MLSHAERRLAATPTPDAVDTRPVSLAEQRQQRTGAVLKIIDKLRDTTDAEWKMPAHTYIREQLGIVVKSLGINTETLPSQKGNPLVKLTADDLDHATMAVMQHDRMTADERRISGVVEDEAGVPLRADAEAILEYIDDQDPRVNFKLSKQRQHECTWSCKCMEKGIINPEHRRGNLWRDGKPYNPPGYSPRVALLRDEWRDRQAAFDHRTRAHEVRMRNVNTKVIKQMAEQAAPIGQGRQGAMDVDPALMEMFRDDGRGLRGVEEQGDPDSLRRHALEANYVIGYNQMLAERGYKPLTADKVLGPAVQRRLEVVPDPGESKTSRIARGVTHRVSNVVRTLGGRSPRPEEPPQRPPLTEEEQKAIDQWSRDSLARRGLGPAGNADHALAPQETQPEAVNGNPEVPNVSPAELPAEVDWQDQAWEALKARVDAARTGEAMQPEGTPEDTKEPEDVFDLYRSEPRTPTQQKPNSPHVQPDVHPPVIAEAD